MGLTYLEMFTYKTYRALNVRATTSRRLMSTLVLLITSVKLLIDPPTIESFVSYCRYGNMHINTKHLG